MLGLGARAWGPVQSPLLKNQGARRRTASLSGVAGLFKLLFNVLSK